MFSVRSFYRHKIKVSSNSVEQLFIYTVLMPRFCLVGSSLVTFYVMMHVYVFKYPDTIQYTVTLPSLLALNSFIHVNAASLTRPRFRCLHVHSISSFSFEACLKLLNLLNE